MNHTSHLKLLLGAVAVLVVLGAFGVPVTSYLPLILVLAICPLMMIFMMKSMTSMDHGDGTESVDSDHGPSAHRH
jgi:hypothetical protein